MNNELGRKITSLTLMTIMVAGGMTFAVPGVMPAAYAANANLFVSAENSQFDNYMSGPQVIEVVVIDSDINDTDESKGEPDVTVNGKELRMIQAVDGNWYGYFADEDMANIADDTTTTAGTGLDFGEICELADSTVLHSGTGQFITDANAWTWNSADCAAPGTPGAFLNVLREAKDINTNVGTTNDTNPPGVDSDAWPFIQLYPLNPTGNVIVQYNKGGGVQTTTLTFDTVDQYAGAELDRPSYPQGSQVHVTVTDLWLNIDPTDEDSWTFGTFGNLTSNYQVFDENGNAPGDVLSNTDANALTFGTLKSLMCEDNCILEFDPDVNGKGVIASLQDNDDSQIVSPDASDPTLFSTAAGFLNGTVPITITEQGPNSGVFGTYDESDVSNLVILSDASRGTSASFDYNETPVTILVGLNFGSIDIMPVDDTWNSGEEIPVELVDQDANQNSRADEDLDLNNPDVALIPSLETGSPNTLSELTSTTITGGMFDGVNDDTVQAFSDRALLVADGDIPVADGDAFSLTFGDMGDVFDSTPIDDSNFNGFVLLNYDIRALENDNGINGTDTLIIDTVDISLAGVSVVNGTNDLQDIILLDRDDFEGLASGTDLVANFTINTSNPGTIADNQVLPVVADVFGFGFVNDGLESDERIANQIIRLELEETNDNSGLFEGSLEYIMINQLNILDPSTYEDLTTIADDPSFIVIEDLTDEDSPRVNYLDLGADGVSTQVADQEEAPSHSGIVSFDLDTYKTADTVVITLEDLDLNVDVDLIDIYTTVSDSSLAPNLDDVVGDDRFNITLSDGDALGRVLDVTFDDQLWTAGNEESCTDSLIADGIDTGLAATGFTLIETAPDSGKFLGDFQIPAQWCRDGSNSPETATGLDIEVNYVDFRDASGEVIEVGDSAGIRANTGSISLDRTVYPVPFGVPDNFGDLSGETSPDNRSIFAIHATGINDDLTVPGSFLPNGDLTIHIRVNDPDFDVSASGEDEIAQNVAGESVGPVEISVIRGSETVILGYAGGSDTNLEGPIHVGNGDNIPGDSIIELSELGEILEAGSGFTAGNVTLSQTGADSATADYADVGIGELSTSELEILTSVDVNGALPSVVDITQAGATDATAFWVDGNDDTNIDDGELTIIDAGDSFTAGIDVSIEDNGTEIATASFTEVTGTIDSIDELIEIFDVVNENFDFANGPVTISKAGADDATIEFTDVPNVRQFGPIDEIAPDAGIFETDITIQYTDGPADSQCPTTVDFDAGDPDSNPESDRFNAASPSGESYCILQGDILQVEYTDPADASGDVNTVTDSATFDLRNGVLQSDKSVYIIGSDMILTLIEPDLDLDNDQAETWDLDLIEWDSDAATVTMGDADGEGAAFDPEPLNFRETGDSTGIFQIVIEIPEELQGDRLERGEEIVLEYTDWGPSGSDFIGDEDEDVNLTLFTSNFGATVELDQKVYSWTDKVYVTVVAPDHNFDGDLIDEIGNSDLDPIKISTRGSDLDNYKLVETGTDTGIFTGEVILTGFTHDADGDSTTGDANGNDVVSTSPRGTGPTDGLLPADDDDGLTVSFEFSEDETVVGSALIRWNIGEVQWLEASYPASGTGVVRTIDPDMNLDPEAVDNFDVDVWSDSDAGGIDLTVTETNEATGIFEGTVFFTTLDESSGHRLRVSEGDTVTAEYEDNTLPDPYTTADELDITATSLIGTVVPPLERAPIASCRVVDSFGNSLSNVSVDQQVQITCDLANGQDREQAFAYLVQVQDANGVTVALAWITGSLSSGQSFSPALSWIPEQAGAYDATTFVWESIDNPTALSPPVSTSISVN